LSAVIYPLCFSNYPLILRNKIKAKQLLPEGIRRKFDNLLPRPPD